MKQRSKVWSIGAAALACAALMAGAGQPGDGKKPEGKSPSAVAGPMDIVEYAASNKDLTTLVGAMRAAGVVDALKARDKKFTLFAPNNAAFTKMPKEKLDELMKPENREQLKSVILFHVVPAEITSAEVIKMQESSKTLQGTTFRFRVRDGKRQVGNEQGWGGLVQTDIKCTNGIVHIIDGVMTPIEPRKEPGKK